MSNPRKNNFQLQSSATLFTSSLLHNRAVTTEPYSLPSCKLAAHTNTFMPHQIPGKFSLPPSFMPLTSLDIDMKLSSRPPENRTLGDANKSFHFNNPAWNSKPGLSLPTQSNFSHSAMPSNMSFTRASNEFSIQTAELTKFSLADTATQLSSLNRMSSSSSLSNSFLPAIENSRFSEPYSPKGNLTIMAKFSQKPGHSNIAELMDSSMLEIENLYPTEEISSDSQVQATQKIDIEPLVIEESFDYRLKIPGGSRPLPYSGNELYVAMYSHELKLPESENFLESISDNSSSLSPTALDSHNHAVEGQIHSLIESGIHGINHFIEGSGNYLNAKFTAISAALIGYERISSDLKNGKDKFSSIICGGAGTVAQLGSASVINVAVFASATAAIEISGGTSFVPAAALASTGFAYSGMVSHDIGDAVQRFCHKSMKSDNSHFGFFKPAPLKILEKIFLPAVANASESHPVCNRPDYASALAAFKQVDGYGNFSKISNLIGGKVKDNFDSGIFQHGCAIRGSRLFNAPKLKEQVNCMIPKIKGETVTGGDGLQYIYRVNTLIKFLTEAWGPPDYDGRKSNQRFPEDGVHGVVIELMPDGAAYGFTGHFEVTHHAYLGSNTLYWHLPIKKPVLLPEIENSESSQSNLSNTFALTRARN